MRKINYSFFDLFDSPAKIFLTTRMNVDLSVPGARTRVAALEPRPMTRKVSEETRSTWLRPPKSLDEKKRDYVFTYTFSNATFPFLTCRLRPDFCLPWRRTCPPGAPPAQRWGACAPGPAPAPAAATSPPWPALSPSLRRPLAALGASAGRGRKVWRWRFPGGKRGDWRNRPVFSKGLDPHQK